MIKNILWILAIVFLVSCSRSSHNETAEQAQKLSSRQTSKTHVNHKDVVVNAFNRWAKGESTPFDLLSSFDEKALGRYFPFKWILAGHIAGGATALLTGPFQFLKAFRNRYMQLHRILGRSYLISIIISAVCAFILTLKTTAAIGVAYTISLQVLIFAWLLTSYMAFATILKRQVLSHQQWMVRSYSCTFAFVVQNYLFKIPVLAGLGTFSEVAPTLIWFSWSVPLLIYQIVLTYQNKSLSLLHDLRS